MAVTALFSPVVEAEHPAHPETASLTTAVAPIAALPTPEVPALSAAPEVGASPSDAAVPLQPARSVALYIDGDNQSPVIARDLLGSVRHDWGLEVARAVVAGNDHGQAVPRWQAALAETLPGDRVLALRVPKTPDAADLALILELGAAMERHRLEPDLVVVVSRDEWLIGAAEAVRARGCRVWVAYAQSEVPPARTQLPTLLLPAVHRAHDSVKAPAAAAHPVTPSPESLLAQVRARCQAQPGGGYRANEVGQALHQLGLTDKAARTRFLNTIPDLREVGTGATKRLIF